MWLQLPNQLNGLFIVQLPDSLENSPTVAKNAYLRISMAFIFTKFLNSGYLCMAILYYANCWIILLHKKKIILPRCNKIYNF